MLVYTLKHYVVVKCVHKYQGPDPQKSTTPAVLLKTCPWAWYTVCAFFGVLANLGALEYGPTAPMGIPNPDGPR